MASLTPRIATTGPVPAAEIGTPPDARRDQPRYWPALVLLAVYWIANFIVAAIDKPYFYGFIYGMAAPALLLILFSIWWWTNRRIALLNRVYGCLLVILTGLAVAPLCHPSVRFGLATDGLARALTVLTLGSMLVSWTGFAWGRLALFVAVALSWSWFALIRIDGLNSELRPTVSWRWEPTAEERFLAGRADSPAPPADADAEPLPALALAPGDWPGFRGADRDGVIPGVALAPDWDNAPPRQLWRQRVGPAWSSVIVIGDRLYTQEQRGTVETVVCYDAATGKELWVHADPCRFEETVSSAGPRATPTFADGRIFTMGARGIVNCLDARTGKRFWSHDITADASVQVPMWGFSGSPLVVDDKVIVYAGGEGARGLLAYHTRTGELVWGAATGPGSYASPQLVTLAGQRQCLMLHDQGLTAIDPADGTVLWQAGAAMPGAPRTHQVHRIGEADLFAATLTGSGVARISVTRQGKECKVSDVWTSTKVKPEFPDFVVHKGHAYGFDGPFFCCVDLASGKRLWKDGRYGRGQVLLLPAADQLLVMTEETGELLLIAADPAEHRELARLQALGAKTWNHPVIAHGRLYVRNAEEMACYELPRP
jgi:outer membrane protein assembly factor BamB